MHLPDEAGFGRSADPYEFLDKNYSISGILTIWINFPQKN